MLLSFSTADAVGIRDEHAKLARLKAGQLPEVESVLEQQNAIELLPAAYMRGKGCDGGLEPPAAGERRDARGGEDDDKRDGQPVATHFTTDNAQRRAFGRAA